MKAPSELTCEELVELVTGYLEGGLDPAERMRFELHVVRCAGCIDYLAQMRQTIDLIGSLGEEPLSAKAEEAFLIVFRDWRQRASTEFGGQSR